MNNKYSHRLKKVLIRNRWKQPKFNRRGDWVIFGLSRFFFSHSEYEYVLSFFGIDIRIWFDRTIINTTPTVTLTVKNKR